MNRYAIPVFACKRLIDDVCFGKCKKILAYGLTFEEVGPMVVCPQPKELCPAFEKEMDEAICDIEGDPVYVRKLKAPNGI